MEFGLVVVLIIILIGSIGIQADVMKTARIARANLEVQLSSTGFKLVSAKRAYFDVGPFHSSGAFRQPVFRITANSADGKLHSGWARWSTVSGQFDLSWGDYAQPA
jgi:hypothetical protein